MNPDPRTQERAKALLVHAAELSEGERTAFLDAVCAGDASLRSRVDSLLSALAEAERVLPPCGLLRAVPGAARRSPRGAQEKL